MWEERGADIVADIAIEWLAQAQNESVFSDFDGFEKVGSSTSSDGIIETRLGFNNFGGFNSFGNFGNLHFEGFGWGDNSPSEDEVIATGVRQDTDDWDQIWEDWFRSRPLSDYFNNIPDPSDDFPEFPDTIPVVDTHTCSSGASDSGRDNAAQTVANEINSKDQNLEHGSLLVLDPTTGEVIALRIVTGNENQVPATLAAATQLGLTDSFETSLTDSGYTWNDVVGIVHSHTPNNQTSLPGDSGFAQYIANSNFINSFPSDNDTLVPSILGDASGGYANISGFAERFTNYIIGADDVLREFGAGDNIDLSAFDYSGVPAQSLVDQLKDAQDASDNDCGG